MQLPSFNKIPSWVYVAGFAAVALYIVKKGGISQAVAGVTAGAVSGVGSVAGGLIGGVGLGVGDLIGLPRTSDDKCKECILRGDDLCAAANCRASVMLRWQYLSGLQKITGQKFTMNDIFK